MPRRRARCVENNLFTYFTFAHVLLDTYVIRIHTSVISYFNIKLVCFYVHVECALRACALTKVK